MYAKDTSVPVERTKQEIEKLVMKYKADTFICGWQGNVASISFRMENRFVKFTLPLPVSIPDKYDPKNYRKIPGNGINEKQLPQLIRSRWRALLLVLKAKLESVEAGISDFETEFLGNVMVGNGQTVADLVKPGLEETYARGGQLALPPGLGG